MVNLSTQQHKILSHSALNTYWRSLSAEMQFTFWCKGIFFNLSCAILLSKLTENFHHPIVIYVSSIFAVMLYYSTTEDLKYLDDIEIGVQGLYQPIEIPYAISVLNRFVIYKPLRSLSLFLERWLQILFSKKVTQETQGRVSMLKRRQ